MNVIDLHQDTIKVMSHSDTIHGQKNDTSEDQDPEKEQKEKSKKTSPTLDSSSDNVKLDSSTDNLKPKSSKNSKKKKKKKKTIPVVAPEAIALKDENDVHWVRPPIRRLSSITIPPEIRTEEDRKELERIKQYDEQNNKTNETSQSNETTRILHARKPTIRKAAQEFDNQWTRVVAKEKKSLNAPPTVIQFSNSPPEESAWRSTRK